MGFVDFATDLAAVLSASRSVASKHIALWARQLDYYGQASTTTSLAAAAREARQSKAKPSFAEGAVTSGFWIKPHAATTSSPRKSRTASLAEQSALGRDGARLAARDTFRAPADGVGPVGPFYRRQRLVPGASPSDIKAALRIGDFSIACLTPSRPRLRGMQGDGGQPLDGLHRTKAERVSFSPAGSIDDLLPRHSIVDLPHSATSGRLRVVEEEWSKRQAPTDWNANGRRLLVESEPRRLSAAAHLVEEAASPELRALKPTIGTELTRTPSSTDAETRNKGDGVRTASETSIREPSVLAGEEEASTTVDQKAGATEEGSKYGCRESKVPSSRLGRVWNYTGLAAGMVAGAISESFSRVAKGGGGRGEGPLMLNPANIERLVARLSKMRGAALKLGQMMSFQDSTMLPGPISQVLQRVQDQADYMPAWQRDGVLVDNLGAEWRGLFEDFEEKPMAAASIGQVHRATLKSNGDRVAVKVQFPGVADSIHSDLDNLGVLLAAGNLLPKGLYLNKTIENARTELAWECDYAREARCAQRYRDLLVGETDIFSVPKIYSAASGKQVLTMEFMDGVAVTRIGSLTQDQRDWIGTQILRLCLREITEFHFMQTDPNWSNFLYDAKRGKLVLLDFGASREYPKRFITLYVRLLAAASRSDRDAVRVLSEELGYLTGHETKAMLDAHVASVLTLAEPFMVSAPEVYDFRDQTITERVKAQIPVMLRERLAPPPEETYSLHRKLSGAFLLCARLGSRVKCRDMFELSVARSRIVKKNR